MSSLWHHVSIPAEVDGFLIQSPTWLPHCVHVFILSLCTLSLFILSLFILSLSLSLLFLLSPSATVSRDGLSRSNKFFSSMLAADHRAKSLACITWTIPGPTPSTDSTPPLPSMEKNPSPAARVPRDAVEEASSLGRKTCL